ncbi:MAG TPA: MYXO-CTERM sorting domain-containing protein [Phycisphaerales bacterium]|nr:MYXO-CTERM sorting domain-containing protein [Phycisphaerales bacterium]HRQ74509.1 MYXO-CTERM sorting domain-containing protein [Phycisphaerales bacterium]
MKAGLQIKALIGAAAVAGLCGLAQAGTGFSYTNGGNNLAIPDGTGTDVGGQPVFLQLTTNEPNYIIKDLNVGIIATHTWQGDVRIWLEHVESGQTIYLINRPGRILPTSTFGYSNDNFGNNTTLTEMIFDDSANGTYNIAARGGVGPAAPGTTNVTGSWRADDIAFEGFGGNSNLAQFNGMALVGTWRLWAQDFAGGDTGALRQFSLYFTANEIPAPGALALLGLAGLAGARRRRA